MMDNQLSKRETNDLVSKANFDKNGQLDLQNFVELMNEPLKSKNKDMLKDISKEHGMNPDTVNELKKIFNEQDKNGSGEITKKLLIAALKNFDPQMSNKDVKDLIKKSDKLGANVSFPNFCALLNDKIQKKEEEMYEDLAELNNISTEKIKDLKKAYNKFDKEN